jgi:hypothetical protein
MRFTASAVEVGNYMSVCGRVMMLQGYIEG